MNKESSPQDLDFALAFGYLHVKQGKEIYDCKININFAWFQDRAFINKLSEIYGLTDTLVVIGYSFPFFNREVDRKIIRSMPKLKKIYIQDYAPLNIKSRFLSILPDWQDRGIQIIPVDDVNEFFLPPEL